MKTVLKHSEVEIKIVELPEGKRKIIIGSAKRWISEKDKCIETHYPIELIQTILSVKGPYTLNDEIRREEDPLYTRACLENDIKAYVHETDFKNKRILDFGCGAGASSIILARMFPEAEIVGIDLSDQLVSLAQARKQYYQYDNLSFLCSPDSKRLPENLGKFDYVILSAVFEHLLPDERETVLQQIWSILTPDGILFINQTPYRYFPFEGHTTHLFFISYLPDKLAHYCACKFSKRIRKEETWNQLLRQGIRGGHPMEIGRILKKAETDFRPFFLKPCYLGFRDRIDIWYSGYAVCIADKYPKVKNIQQILKYVAKLIYFLSGIVFLPTVSVAIKKAQKT
ncbi:MAG: class I SAM-dependent methyltransferase [Planctomycetota bacterium]|jgi:2-polyprenyl-3-methyl-5-hydroxy-6-metoxy-1,4-benzoquinol methylase